MLRDLGQCHFEKIEAAVQIRYGISLAHRFHSGRELNPAARLSLMQQNWPVWPAQG